MKIATWNVNSLTVRQPQVLDWLASSGCDVLVLQEIKMEAHKFAHDTFSEAGYQSFAFGQKTYNGVALIVKQGLAVGEVQHNNPLFEDAQARIISALVDGVHITGAYFPNGQEPGSEKFSYKLAWLDALALWQKQVLAQHPNCALLGDFNITADDRDSYDPEGLRETIHHTSIERQHFQALLDLGYVDAYRLFEQADKSFSWWDYRNFAFRRNHGLRIDHVFVSQALKDQVTACSIDKAPRKNERPSDHTPVVLELAK